MKTKFSCSFWLAALLAAAPAQQPAAAPKTTAAEQAFRDGWWAESGQGDLATALAKYLAAAAAEGPAAVRAKALLNAGAVQQRLGKAESAIATFRQLLKEHPEQADLVEQARVHLRELTAVDLTTGYDEWYERRLFSEEVQLQILDRIQALVKDLGQMDARASRERDAQMHQRRALRGEILAFGKGAVPALRKACESGNEQLAEAAVEMLFELRQVPPFAALRRLTGWTNDSGCWRLLLQSRSTEPRSQATEPSAHERLVFAAMEGAASLRDTLLDLTFTDEDNPVAPIAVALMQHDAESRQRIREAMAQREVPLMTRKALQRAVLESEPRPPFTAAEWLAIGEDPLVFELRICAVGQAARQLGEQDGALLDTLLERVATAPHSARAHFCGFFASGLLGNASPLLVPWSVERLRRYVHLGARCQDSEFGAVLNVLRGDDALRTMLATAVLADPVAMHAAFHPAEGSTQPDNSLAGLFHWDNIEERQAELLSTRWYTTLHEVVRGGTLGGWPRWSDPERAAATAILGELTAVIGDPKGLRDFFAGVRKDADASLHEPIDRLLEQLQR